MLFFNTRSFYTVLKGTYGPNGASSCLPCPLGIYNFKIKITQHYNILEFELKRTHFNRVL